MKKKKIPAADRRLMILKAARRTFASTGFERTSVQQIAKEVGVSSALIFQHFPTKEALHQAVLDDFLREQDETFALFGQVQPSAHGLVAMLFDYFSHCVFPSEIYTAEGCRFELASIAGEGSYARLLSTRAAAVSLERFTCALEAARASGQLSGAIQDPRNVRTFLHCVGTMLTASSASGEEVLDLGDDRMTILRNAVSFCSQGLGLNAEFVSETLVSLTGD